MTELRYCSVDKLESVEECSSVSSTELAVEDPSVARGRDVPLVSVVEFSVSSNGGGNSSCSVTLSCCTDSVVAVESPDQSVVSAPHCSS